MHAPQLSADGPNLPVALAHPALPLSSLGQAEQQAAKEAALREQVALQRHTAALEQRAERLDEQARALVERDAALQERESEFEAQVRDGSVHGWRLCGHLMLVCRDALVLHRVGWWNERSRVLAADIPNWPFQPTGLGLLLHADLPTASTAGQQIRAPPIL